jgi:hypothetical protein
LRTNWQPDGKDNLTGVDKLKTELANQLYDALTEVILLANSLDICLVVENPANSFTGRDHLLCDFYNALKVSTLIFIIAADFRSGVIFGNNMLVHANFVWHIRHGRVPSCGNSARSHELCCKGD